MATKIRVHNKGKREFTIPPAPGKKGEKKGKKRMLQPGRAIEIEEKLALKMIVDYPQDLIEFESLVSGEKKNLSKENNRLESVNKSLTGENAQLKKDSQELKDKIQRLEDKIKGLPKLEDDKAESTETKE